MKYLIWVIFLPLAVVLIVFGVSNRAPVPVDLWPLPLIAEIPLFALLIVTLLAGVIWGGVATWLRAGRSRTEARRLGRELRSMTLEMERQKRAAETLKAQIKARDENQDLPSRDAGDAAGLLRLENTAS